MKESHGQPYSLSAEALLRWGTFATWGGLVFTLLLLGGMCWKAPQLLPYIPVVLLAIAAALLVLKHPMRNLVTLLAAFVLIADYEDGIQLTEVLYGLYYLGFLSYFLTTRIFLHDDRMAERFEEKALLGFMIVVAVSLGSTILFSGSMREVVSQGTALALLLLCFPIKEAFLRDDRAAKLLFVVVAWVGIFAAFRNFYMYYSMLSSAEHLWQIARGRVYTNDNILMVASVAMLILFISAKHWKHRIVLLPAFLLPLGGLVLTQSRGFWVAFAFAVVLLIVLFPRTERVRLMLFAIAGITLAAGVGLLLFGDAIMLIASGLWERVGTLSTATTKDISLVNRFLESDAVWQRIMRNPIMGYGIGVPYRFLDITYMATRVDTFIHNAFLAVWYRFGVFGLALLLTTWGGAILRGYQAYREKRAPRFVRLAGLTSTVCLIAYLLPANTSNPFHLNDSLFIFGVLLGLAFGASACARRCAHERSVPVLP